MIDLFPTSREPGRSLRRQAADASRARTACSRSRSATAYAQGDVPEHGTRVLVVTDNAKAKGDALARALGEEVRAKRGTWAPPDLGLDEAIDAAYAAAEGADRRRRPVRQCRRRRGLRQHQRHPPAARARLERRRVGPLWDPVAVQFCHAAGVGTTLPLRFGGKTAITSGAPIDAEVTSSASSATGASPSASAKVPFGDARRHPRRRRRGLADLAPDAGARARDLLRRRHRRSPRRNSSA